MISILLPVYNAEESLSETLQSILNQSYQQWELVIINDGSTDRSETIIQSYTDSRIRYYKNDSNLGLIATLNKGLTLVKGKYVARMDSDDIMAPERLQTEINFLEGHPEIALCGSDHIVFNPDGFRKRQYYFRTTDEIKAELLFNTPFSHPTILIRKEVLLKYTYRKEYIYAEDYKLWQEILSDGFCAANIPSPLLFYRIGNVSQTSKGETLQEQRFQIISKIQQEALTQGLKLHNNDYYARLHFHLSTTERLTKLSLKEYPLKDIRNYLYLLLKQNKKEHYVSSQSLGWVLGKIWIKLLRAKWNVLSGKEKSSMVFSKLFFKGMIYVIHYHQLI